MEDLMGNTAIKMENISKYFGPVVANENVSFEVLEGEIHALLGENGAGKSTLMNMLSGIYTPDTGEIYVRGQKVRFSSPKDAIKMGIGMVSQHFKLVEVHTAAENIIAGGDEKFFLNKKKIYEKLKKITQDYGFEVNLEKPVYEMSVSEKQTIEIIKVLYRGARILILDEPTAVLTPQEGHKLFSILRKMKAQGCAIVIITHKMAEVMEIADRITVLRKGQAVKTLDKDKTNPNELTELMVGRSVNLSIERPETEKVKNVFKVKNLTVRDQEKVKVLDDVSFSVSGGEILGIAGVAGSGQKELCETIAGLMRAESGEIIYNGENILGLDPRKIIDKGISMSFIPEDRLGMGLVASMGMVDNLILKEYYKTPGIFVKRQGAAEKAKELVKLLDIKTPDINTPVKLLSGGNIQKVLVGRELSADLHVLVTAYPVRGLDVNTSYAIYEMLNEQKKKGVAIIYVGEDLDVLLELCDRILVLYEGKVAGIKYSNETTKEELGLLMAGMKEGGISA